ncbi:D-alanyl-D-alanine carboxypeptidase family protein [Paenibacillus chartarius]|uniref:D-alanyl-D-alanine carboxypeptidase family protein n=1 Tax=Paenibacillus chartarius TaxID=747481 RepID=A0ABV6DKC8_9BACL
MNDYRIRRHAAAFLLCTAALLNGCSSAQPDPTPAASTAPAPEASAPAAEKPAASPSAGTGGAAKSAYASLTVEPAALSLSPGAKMKLTVTGVKKDQSKQPLAGDKSVTFTASEGSVISIAADGTVTASAKAKSGQHATVTVQYEGMKKEIPVTVKTSLEDTVKTVSGVPTVTNSDAIDVVVNKKRNLPSTYAPKLVEPNVPFTFKEKIDKRMLRSEAAQALEQLFAGAKKDGIQLYGVSAYRSYATQKSLFSSYVKTHGEKEAGQFSAQAGQSEHQTGLAIDVGDGNPKCDVQDCFADTKAAKWLAANSAEYGFIIRYPKGKESITGYQYEPWHIRYIGVDAAKEIAERGITLEEYFEDAVAAGASQ